MTPEEKKFTSHTEFQHMEKVTCRIKSRKSRRSTVSALVGVVVGFFVLFFLHLFCIFPFLLSLALTQFRVSAGAYSGCHKARVGVYPCQAVAGLTQKARQPLTFIPTGNLVSPISLTEP